jgi:hypothetical protein
MLLQSTLSYFAFVASVATALPSKQAKAKPPFFALAGDSTTATQSAGGGGKHLGTLYPIQGITLTTSQAGAMASLTRLSRAALQERTSATTAQRPFPSVQAATGPMS